MATLKFFFNFLHETFFVNILVKTNNYLEIKMNQAEHDEGVLAVLIKRFEHERYPRMLELKKNVDDGGVLDERDLNYIEHILTDAHQVMTVLTRHPEYAPLAQKCLVLYEEIMSQSQKNSKSL
jgi:hypothetical protein